MEQALKKGGNKSFELVRLPNLNHLFQKLYTTGSPVEYQNIEETLDQGFLQKVGEWIQKQSQPAQQLICRFDGSTPVQWEYSPVVKLVGLSKTDRRLGLRTT